MKAKNGMGLPILTIVVGFGMIVGAAAIDAIWEKHQVVTVTPVFEVTSTIADVSLGQGASQPYTITVKNLGATSVSVTLSCTMTGTGTGVTATIMGEATRTIAGGHTDVYIVTIDVASDAEGAVEFTYLLTQNAL